MKELNKKEIYSLDGLSEEQLKELAEKCGFVYFKYFKNADYIRYGDMIWEHGLLYDNLIEPTAKAIDLFEVETTSQLFGITSDKVVQSVMNDLNERSRIGVEKYNTTLEREDLSLKDWLQHTYEETLDKANYLKRAILELEKNDTQSK